MTRTTLTQHPFFRAFQHRSFTLLWLGQLLSRLGDFLYHIALAWWVLEVSGSATAMASVLIVSVGPTIVFTLIGGVAADRYPRLPIMISSDVARGVIVLVVAFLTTTGQLQMWHVYALSLFFGLVDAFFQPAYMATIPTIVPSADLTSANSLSSLAIQAGRVAGPPIGAALIAISGIGTAFAINGMTFLISAVFLLLIKQPASQPTDPSIGQPTSLSFSAEFTSGIKLVAAKAWLWLAIIVFALTNITLAGPYSVSLPFLVNDAFDANVNALGTLYALFAIGYVIGGIWLGRAEHINHPARYIFGGTAVAGLTFIAFSLPIGIVGLGIAAVVNGIALEMGNLAWINLLQERIPADKLGRVISVDTVGSIALMPVGYALAGWATDLLGAPRLFLLAGVVTAIVSLLVWLHPAIAKLNQPKEQRRALNVI